MSKPGYPLAMPGPDEDAVIAAGISADPDTFEPTREEILRMTPIRGRPRSGEPKVLLSVRYSQEVVDFFRATGKGWQSRMNDALKDWIVEHPTG